MSKRRETRFGELEEGRRGGGDDGSGDGGRAVSREVELAETGVIMVRVCHGCSVACLVVTAMVFGLVCFEFPSVMMGDEAAEVSVANVTESGGTAGGSDAGGDDGEGEWSVHIHFSWLVGLHLLWSILFYGTMTVRGRAVGRRLMRGIECERWVETMASHTTGLVLAYELTGRESPGQMVELVVLSMVWPFLVVAAAAARQSQRVIEMVRETEGWAEEGERSAGTRAGGRKEYHAVMGHAARTSGNVGTLVRWAMYATALLPWGVVAMRFVHDLRHAATHPVSSPLLAIVPLLELARDVVKATIVPMTSFLRLPFVLCTRELLVSITDVLFICMTAVFVMSGRMTGGQTGFLSRDGA